MFSFGKAKRIVNIVIDDYMIRMVENNGKDLSSINISAEKLLPEQTVQNGKLIDDMGFFEFMKELVDEWDLKKRHVRFYVPHELVIMRELDLTEDVVENELKQYITMEIGHTIHFPFNDPVFDIYDTRKLADEKKVTVLAAPEEEIIKYVNVFHDVHLTAESVDVQPLGIYRYFVHDKASVPDENVYLVFEANITSSNISIFNKHYLEFLRFQATNIPLQDWQPTERDGKYDWTFTGDESILQMELDDQANEIDRIMNFYRFSLHQGNQTVTHIVLVGDLPQLDTLKQLLEQRYNVEIMILQADELGDIAMIPALGLALKGAN